MSTIVAIVLLAGALSWAWSDYRAWLALGKGGLPSNIRGWLITSRMRLRKRDPLDITMYSEPEGNSGADTHLGALPGRCGPRPKIARWPIPHRQLDQFIGSEMRRRLDEAFDSAVRRHSALVGFQLSHYERQSPAITLCRPDCGHAHAGLSCGEVAHIHPGDGSMHMILSVGDASVAIGAGWAERHPMSGVLPELPNTYLYVYPPRDALELGVVEQLLEASIRHMATPSATARPHPVAENLQ
jgi:hypothetical protein